MLFNLHLRSLANSDTQASLKLYIRLREYPWEIQGATGRVERSVREAPLKP